jgi:diguanylate cyclase (GGDEF)-like protein/PAS domain S-box-containing protein
MGSPTQPVTRAELTRAWSEALCQPAGVPIPCSSVEGCTGERLGCLIEALDYLIAALKQEPFSPQPAVAVGATIVAHGLTRGENLGRTVEILGHTLPELPELRAVEGLADKVVTLLGVLSSGFTTALHRRDFEQSEAWFQEVFDFAPVGMMLSRLDSTVTKTNSALAEMLQYPAAALAGHDVAELFHPDDAALLRASYQGLGDGKPAPFRMRRAKLLDANGDTAVVTLTVLVLRDPAGNPTHHIAMIEDVTDAHLLQERLRHQSLHDLLTGLPARNYFLIHFDALRERAGPGTTIVLCKIDLDGFAVVNDGLGQGMGDLLLRSVAGRLQALVAGEQAMVARFGADEFAILIEESPTTPNTAALAAAINTELSEPVYLANRGLAVSACVGIVRRPAREMSTAELLRAAEATLHRAKRTGRGQWAEFDPPVDALERRRYSLAVDMTAAWENGQVTLCYQPLVQLGSTAAGRTVAMAALLSWDHPERGAVSHEDCVTLAEQTGLVLTLGPWMLQQACEHLRSWRDQLGAAVPPVRVDLTTHLTQDPDLVAVVRGALAAAQLQPEDIQLGMPVEVIVAGHGDAVDNVATLADIGVRTVLTRYGQAVGNLALLESLPVYGVEMADSLVRTTTGQPDSCCPRRWPACCR